MGTDRAERGQARYTIAAVSKLTGVSCHALRVWERRYGFPAPGRSGSGHRRYDAEQVEVLRRVAVEVRAGRPPGESIAGVLARPRPSAPAVAAAGGGLDGLAAALMAGDLVAAERAYGELTAALAPEERIARVVEPLLVDVGERWFRGQCQIYQERCASGFLRRKLALMLDEAQAANPGPRSVALVGTAEGERHEGGAMILSVLLERAGWRAVSLGTDLPTGEYQKAVDLWAPAAVCVSFVMSRNVNRRFAELARLRGAPVFVGGRSVINYRTLARRHGLVALTGPARESVGRLIAEAGAWAERAGTRRRRGGRNAPAV
jgi:methanogenic corrinoid protein MtbC1